MYDLIIFGAGPAGLTAGIYAARGGLKCAIVETKAVGGQAAITPDVENYPGIDNVAGYKLVFDMQRQCEKFGVTFVFDQIKKLDLQSDVKSVETEFSGTLEAKAVIIASGAQPRKLGVAREDELLGRGISYCATCDGAFFKGKKVTVVGGGNTAVEDALYLQKFASEVYLVHRRGELRAVGVTAEKLLESGVKVLWNSRLTALFGDKKLDAVEISSTITSDKQTLPMDGVFMAVGQAPASAVFDGVNVDEGGYIVADERTLATNVKGVFAAGDVRQKQLRQIVTATADGAIAVDSVMRFLA